MPFPLALIAYGAAPSGSLGATQADVTPRRIDGADGQEGLGGRHMGDELQEMLKQLLTEFCVPTTVSNCDMKRI